MAEIIHEPAVAIVPRLGHFDGTFVVFEKWTAQFASRFRLKCDATRVLHQQQPERRRDRALERRARSLRVIRKVWWRLTFSVRVGALRQTESTTEQKHDPCRGENAGSTGRD